MHKLEMNGTLLFIVLAQEFNLRQQLSIGKSTITPLLERTILGINVSYGLQLMRASVSKRLRTPT